MKICHEDKDYIIQVTKNHILMMNSQMEILFLAEDRNITNMIYDG